MVMADRTCVSCQKHNTKFTIVLLLKMICSSLIILLGHLVFHNCHVLFLESMSKSLRSIGAWLFDASSERLPDLFLDDSILSFQIPDAFYKSSFFHNYSMLLHDKDQMQQFLVNCFGFSVSSVLFLCSKKCVGNMHVQCAHTKQ